MKKGQLVSLDFLFAVALTVLVIGVATTFLQVASFEAHLLWEQTQIENQGHVAALLLVSNPALACQIKDISGQVIGTLNNCIDSTKSVTKGKLGLAQAFEFNIFNKTDQALIAASALVPPQTKNVFTTEFKAIVYPGQMPKTVLYNCLKKKSSCNFPEKDIIVSVWK